MVEQLAALLADETRFRELTRKTFSEDDLDGSGFLDAAEIHKIMQKIARATGAVDPLPREVKQVMDDADLNHDGTVNYEEYLEFARKLLTAVLLRMRNPASPQPPEEKKEPKAVTRPAKTPENAKKKEPAKPPAEVPAEVRKVTPKEVRRETPQEPPRAKLEAAAKPSRGNRAEAISERMTQFEEFLTRSKLNEAMQLIYVEIETQKVEPAQVYKYTATRLRQLSQDPNFMNSK